MLVVSRAVIIVFLAVTCLAVITGFRYGVLKPLVETLTETVNSLLTSTLIIRETYTTTLTSTLTVPPATVTSTEIKTETSTETVTSRETYTTTLTKTLTSTFTPSPVTVTTTEIKVESVTETVTNTLTVTEYSSTFTRFFDVYLVREQRWVRVFVEIPPNLVGDYLGYRVPVYAGEEKETYSRLISDAVKQAPIYNLATNLWELAGGDLELYGAYLMQVLHQMTYNYSKAYVEYLGVQPPITTLIENSGVCADYALLYASLLKVVNASFVLVEVKVWDYEANIINGSHLVVGVKLPKPPSLPQEFHSYFLINQGYVGNYSWAVDSETYYIADPTPSGYIFIEEPEGKLIPPTVYYPTFIGEHCWDRIEVVKIFHIEG